MYLWALSWAPWALQGSSGAENIVSFCQADRKVNGPHLGSGNIFLNDLKPWKEPMVGQGLKGLLKRLLFILLACNKAFKFKRSFICWKKHEANSLFPCYKYSLQVKEFSRIKPQFHRYGRQCPQTGLGQAVERISLQSIVPQSWNTWVMTGISWFRYSIWELANSHILLERLVSGERHEFSHFQYFTCFSLHAVW